MAVAAHTTSRRSFLAAAAVAGTIAAPSVAVTKENPDAELIRLGKELQRLRQEHAIAVSKFLPYWEEHMRLMKEWEDEHSRPAWGETFAAYDQLSAECGLTDFEKSNVHPDDVLNLAGPVSEAILAIPAMSLSGLLVKAQLAKFGAENWWEESEKDRDWDKRVMTSLCDAVIDMAAQIATLEVK